MKLTVRNMSVYASAVKDIAHVSIVPEVQIALAKWIKSKTGNTAPGVLIGGLAMSFYAKPRYTEDVDLLFLKKEDVPDYVEGFKPHRTGAMQENYTHVEIEMTTAESVNLPVALVRQVFETAIDHGGLLVASKEAMIALKLFGAKSPKREFKDLNDVVSIFADNNPAEPINMNPWLKFFGEKQKTQLADAKKRASAE